MEHGGVGTPHSRGGSGMVTGAGAGEVGSFSWCSRARLVGSVTRRRGGSSAHRPSGRDPATGVTSQRAIGLPSRAGGLMPRQSGNFDVFGLSALSQESDLIFARKREILFWALIAPKPGFCAAKLRLLRSPRGD